MSTTTVTYFRDSTDSLKDGTLTALSANGQTFTVANPGGSDTYYELGTAGAPVSITIDTTAPTNAVFASAPTAQSTAYADKVINITEATGIDWSTVTVTAAEGTVSDVKATDNNSLTIDYTTPAQATDTVTVAGSDLAGNAFSLDISLEGLTA